MTPAGLSRILSIGLIHVLLTALRTDAVKFEYVRREEEAEAKRHFFLKALDFDVFELDDLAARRASEVIVVIARGPFVTCRHAAHADFGDEACVGERAKKSIDRGEPDFGIALLDSFKNVLCREVVRPAAHDLQNIESLLSHF